MQKTNKAITPQSLFQKYIKMLLFRYHIKMVINLFN